MDSYLRSVGINFDDEEEAAANNNNNDDSNTKQQRSGLSGQEEVVVMEEDDWWMNIIISHREIEMFLINDWSIDQTIIYSSFIISSSYSAITKYFKKYYFSSY